MNEDYCDYKLSLALKAAGFDEPCDSYYDKTCAADDEYWHTKREEAYNWNGLDSDCQTSAPTLWQAQKWLREQKNWHIIIDPRIWESLTYGFRLWHRFRGYENADKGFYFSSYERALSAGISAVLKLIKKGE